VPVDVPLPANVAVMLCVPPPKVRLTPSPDPPDE